jgi:hypothetical protein
MKKYEKHVTIETKTTEMTNSFNNLLTSKPPIQTSSFQVPAAAPLDQVDNHQKSIITSKTTTTEFLMTSEIIEPISPIPHKNETSIAPVAAQENTKRAKIINRYESLSFDLDVSKPFSINISYYEHANLFFAQLNVPFMEFDVFYDEFQASCDKSDRMEASDLKLAQSGNKLSNLALAAKFTEDNCWYRARIVIEDELTKAALNASSSNNHDLSVLVEFIDYGNTQKTSLKECVFLSEQFARFKACAVKCNGVAYLDTVLNLNKIKNSAVSNLLFYGRVDDRRDDEPDEVKSTYDQVYFTGTFFFSHFI